MAKFDLGKDIDYESLTRKYELYLPKYDDPIVVTLAYAGAENKTYTRKMSNLILKYRAQAQRKPQQIPDLSRRAARELFPGLIVKRCENVPERTDEGIRFVTVTEQEDLADFCRVLIPSLFDELIEQAGQLSQFVQDDGGPTDEEVKQVADELGKS